MSQVTRLLDEARNGDARAAGELLPLVYDELRRLAAHKMAVSGGMKVGESWRFENP